ncbi:MAG: AraC family transcriptional regulator [Lachnospiraceae bacterium]|nr:AraC family transcriptional regulator [Lachnospiraceae bacterium]
MRKSEMSAQFNDTGIEIYDVINKAKRKASPSVAMGIDALLLMNKGNTAKEIGKQFNKTANTITAVVSKAKKYLREDNYNITQIAYMLGYSTVHYFSRQFKKFTGMSPSQYTNSVKAIVNKEKTI